MKRERSLCTQHAEHESAGTDEEAEEVSTDDGFAEEPESAPLFADDEFAEEA